MKIITTHFRCDLCGKHRNHGVTEDDPSIPTKVCTSCISKAVDVVLATIVERASFTGSAP